MEVVGTEPTLIRDLVMVFVTFAISNCTLFSEMSGFTRNKTVRKTAYNISRINRYETVKQQKPIKI